MRPKEDAVKMKSEKKHKRDREEFILSSPTNFQAGIHLSPDNMDSLDSISRNIPDILRVELTEEMKRKRKEEEYREREEQKRVRKDEKRAQKDESKNKRIAITGPLHVEHKLHVDENLNWTDAHSLQLLNKLGEGTDQNRAYGIVYKALHVPTNSELAVKTIPISENCEESSDLTKEINILKQCRHDNVVSLYGCVFSEDSLWIIMDYCGAGSVKDFMKHSPRAFTEKEISAVLRCVLHGLQYLHSNLIIHRDLKSANILLTDTGEAKIADFGVSFQVSNTLAKKNTVVGTPLFMSPESLESGDYSEKADIWSLGITAIEMHDGVPPYNDEHIMRAMLLITTNDPPTLQNPTSASPEFHQFLARCLRKGRDERATAKELLEDPFIANNEDYQETLQGMVNEYKALKKQQELAKREAEERLLELEREKRQEHERKVKLFEKMQEDTFVSPRGRERTGNAPLQETIEMLENEFDELKKLAEIQSIFAKEAKYYSNMSYGQLVAEIREMKSLLREYDLQD